MAASFGSDKVRQTAFDFLIDVARTGSHLQMFVDYIGTMRGWGRGLRKAIGNWYTQRPLRDAVYQAVEYRQRYNWTHRDLLRKSHPVGYGPWGELFAWITDGTMPSEDDDHFALIHAYEEAKTADVSRLTALITKYRMSREMVPSEMLDKQAVWQALAHDGPAQEPGDPHSGGGDRPDGQRMGLRNAQEDRDDESHPPDSLSYGAADISGRPWRPGATHVDSRTTGRRRPGRSLRPLLLAGPADQQAAILGHRRVWLNESWRGRRRPRIEPQDGSGRYGDGHCPPRAELLHGRVRGLSRRESNTRLREPANTRHVAPGHHGIRQHLRRHAEDQGSALRKDRLRPAHAARYGDEDERGLLHHFHHCRIIVTPLS